MTTTQKYLFVCVFCGQEFKDDVAVGSDTFSAQDTDFRTHSLGVKVIPNNVHTCPFCGFTDYLHEDKLEDEDRERILEYLDSYGPCEGFQGLSPTKKFELLANIFKLRNRPSMEIAQVYLRAAWMAEDEANIELGIRFREYAEDYFVKALDNQEVEKEKTPSINYLVGELNRRVGRFDEALEWFSKVRSEDPRMIRLCKQQKYLASVRKAVNARMPEE